jgi:hypothetical protein
MTGAPWPVVPVTPLARLLWHELPGLVGASLVFLAWTVPSSLLAALGLRGAALVMAPLTVGPGLAGLMTYAGRLARGEAARPWGDSLTGARRGGVAGAAHAAAILLAARAAATGLTLAAAPDATPAAVALWTGQAATLACLGMVEVHALGLIGLHGQGPLRAARNGFLLAARAPGVTLGLVSLAGAAGVLSVLLAGGPLVVLPGALAVCGAFTTLALLERSTP